MHKIDLLKIDVEGFEQRVLLGGEKTIQRFKPHMIIEAHPLPLLHRGSNVAEVMRMIEELGYLPFEVRRKQLFRVLQTPENDDVVTWFCFHRDKLPGHCQSS